LGKLERYDRGGLTICLYKLERKESRRGTLRSSGSTGVQGCGALARRWEPKS